jgi:hypothetical protein
MNYKISFREMDILVREKLLKQLPTTLEEKRKQLEDLKKLGPVKKQKKRLDN